MNRFDWHSWLWAALAGTFVVGVGVHIVRRLLRKMTTDAFWAAAVPQSLTLVAVSIGMSIQGWSLFGGLVIVGLYEIAVLLSTWGRPETYFGALADRDSWTSSQATIIALRFCAVAVILAIVSLPLLLKIL